MGQGQWEKKQYVTLCNSYLSKPSDIYAQETGSITIGKKANFVAVDRDLTEGGFANAQITHTWFEGEIVFDITGKLTG